jgi:CheY-like chemotaxis protein
MTDHPSGFVVEVVDDDQSVLDSLELLLESADYTVRSFDSATVLLDSRCLAEIDYLISDVDMPVINGFQLLPMVHAARPGLPIALITGHPELLSQVPSSAKVISACSRSRSTRRSYSPLSATLYGFQICADVGRDRQRQRLVMSSASSGFRAETILANTATAIRQADVEKA